MDEEKAFPALADYARALTKGTQPTNNYNFTGESQSSLFRQGFWQAGIPISFLRHHSPKTFQSVSKQRPIRSEGILPIDTDVEMVVEQDTRYPGVPLT
jgi:hypothetical protein